MFLNDTINLVVTPRRNDGSLGAIADTPIWSADATVTLAPSLDGFSCAVTGVAVGPAVVTCSATNTVGLVVTGTFAVEVTLAPADLLEITQI